MNPKLRFAPGQGLNYPAYTFKPLADVCEIRREIVDLSNLTDVRFVEYSMPAFDAGQNPQLIWGSDAKSGRISICGDVLLFNKLNVRKKRIWNVKNSPDNSVCSAEFIPVIATGVLQDYMYYAVSTDRFTKAVEECSSGTSNSQKRITPSIFLEQEIACPCSQEQQKIAAFFMVLDEKIRLSQQKIDIVLDIKKGIAKRIFSQEVHVKSTDGSFFKQWKLHTVGELAEVIGGGTPSTIKPEYWDGEIYWLTPTEINSKYVHASNRKITSEGLNNSSAKLLPKGALLLTTRATLGACSINNQDNPVCTNQGFQSLVCNDLVNNEYMYYVVTDDAFQKAMFQRASGSTFLEISSKNLRSIAVNLPSLEEQRQIVMLLSAIDKKVECLKQKVEVLKKQKASFMQQMFI